MTDTQELVSRYVAVWNEADVEERHRKIRSLWTADGTTCHRLLDAHGYEAIEVRVRGSWDRWLREGRYMFRLKTAAAHHEVIKVDFNMVRLPEDEVEARGLSFLILHDDGRVRHDYQFNPTASDADDLVQSYVAVFNETDAATRRQRIAKLWAPDCTFVSEATVRVGHDGIEAEARAAQDALAANGGGFSSANYSQRHHNLARIKWQLQADNGGEAAIGGSDLLVFDDYGRIRHDYRFAEPV